MNLEVGFVEVQYANCDVEAVIDTSLISEQEFILIKNRIMRDYGIYPEALRRQRACRGLFGAMPTMQQQRVKKLGRADRYSERLRQAACRILGHPIIDKKTLALYPETNHISF
ncbi:hypothetical protein [Paenibacillus sp. B01]|uniref:hypothetical protein n=1 Tax=Paenibacillus sp. B01 TaxID=2660554 RepID=UPI00129A512D|nr:hypothetical protein [Paenibacillus sp. B01]QGG57829.1 hypothetical protein GE073_21180 [Paenibacillus sp. B01]